MNIIICEPEYPTHFHFIKHLIPSLSSRFEKVYVAVSVTADTNAHYVSTIKPLELTPNTVVLKIFEDPTRKPHEDGFEIEEEEVRKHNFELLEQTLVEKQISKVIALTGDKLIPLIEQKQLGDPNSPWNHVETHLGVHWLFLPLRPGVPEPRQAPGIKYAKTDIASVAQANKVTSLINIHPKSIFVQNFLGYVKLRKMAGIQQAACIHLPVPIDVFNPITKEAARSKLSLTGAAPLVGMTGSIQRRKGVKLLIQALRDDSFDTRIRVLLMGPFEDAVESFIRENCEDLLQSGRLIVRNQALDSFTQHVVISACDVVICNLLEHPWSSDIALRAIAAERPFIASDGEWFQYVTTHFAAGMTVAKPVSAKAVARVIRDSVAKFADFESTATAHQIVDFNHPANFVNTTMRALTDAGSDLALPPLIRWPDQ